MEKYTFHLNPQKHQPSGFADFSKIFTPENAILTYKNLNSGEQEEHNITRTEIIDENGIKRFIYIFPIPFVK